MSKIAVCISASTYNTKWDPSSGDRDLLFRPPFSGDGVQGHRELAKVKEKKSHE
jgi:hypothetical protein